MSLAPDHAVDCLESVAERGSEMADLESRDARCAQLLCELRLWQDISMELYWRCDELNKKLRFESRKAETASDEGDLQNLIEVVRDWDSIGLADPTGYLTRKQKLVLIALLCRRVVHKFLSVLTAPVRGVKRAWRLAKAPFSR